MDINLLNTYLVELVAQIDRIDIIAFQVGKHDHKENHDEQQQGGHNDAEQEQQAFSWHGGFDLIGDGGIGGVDDWKANANEEDRRSR
ncbi:hypothetical protein BC937DRAFT_95217, partial [Endogone sp. FLAS-F59071]